MALPSHHIAVKHRVRLDEYALGPIDLEQLESARTLDYGKEVTDLLPLIDKTRKSKYAHQ
jgi:hypothetical protein